MKFTDRPKWKRIILAFICLIGLLAAAGGSFAAYTSQAFQRGVARNRDTETIRFTSNYLQICASTTDASAYAGRTILFGEEKKESPSLKIELEVYNYANGNTALVSQRDITYNLKVEFLGAGGNGNDYSVSDSDEARSTEIVRDEDSDGSSAFTYMIKEKTLTGRAANAHSYILTFPGSDLDRLKIRVTAIPTDLSVTNNQILAAVIAPGTASTTKTFVAKGEFIDESDVAPSAYDGFNYEISISSGTADAELTWEKDKVEIDQFFLENLGKTDEEIKEILKTGSLNLSMNQSNGSGDYLIPFYVKDKTAKYWETITWDRMKEIIKFSAKQKNS